MLRRLSALAALGLIASLSAVVPASAQGAIPCAGEGGFCRVPYPTTVYYGYRGRVTARQVNGGGIPCNNNVFGDPAPGVPKSCSFAGRGYEQPRQYERQDRYDRRDRDDRRYDRRGY
jgi:hypothetical protein